MYPQRLRTASRITVLARYSLYRSEDEGDGSRNPGLEASHGKGSENGLAKLLYGISESLLEFVMLLRRCKALQRIE